MARKPDDWMPLHIGPYLADTTNLTRDQHGAYLLLLMAYWRRGGPLPADDGQLAAMAKASPAEWRRIKPVISPLFVEVNGMWTQKRADQELARARHLTEVKAEAGRKGAANKWQTHGKGDGTAMAKTMQKACQTDAPIPCTSTEAKASTSLREVCAEPSATAPSVVALPTNRFVTTGEEVGVSQAQVDDYAATYPAVDVMQQLRQVRRWLMDNPAKRKTAKGMARFINQWLSKEQDKGSRNGNFPAKPTPHRDFQSAGIEVARDYLGPPEGCDDSGFVDQFGRPLLSA